MTNRISDHTQTLDSYSHLTKYSDRFRFVYKDDVLPNTKFYPLSVLVSDVNVEVITQLYVKTLEEEMSKVLEHNSCGVVYFSPSSKFLYINRTAKELYMFEYDDCYVFESNFAVVGGEE